jgi:hypothetical protein
LVVYLELGYFAVRVILIADRKVALDVGSTEGIRSPKRSIFLEKYYNWLSANHCVYDHLVAANDEYERVSLLDVPRVVGI